MAAPTRGARRPVVAALTLAVVAGVGLVSVLPGVGLTATGTASADDLDASPLAAKQSVALDVSTASLQASRDEFAGLSVQQQREEAATSYRAQMASLPRFIGDDYPFKALGTGMSPLNYGLQNCTDFVAWRLNRDAGSSGAPWLMAWSYLTPNGGDAYEWEANWEAKGWLVSAVPVVGSVAWFPGMNHVAYVARVNADGTVLVEEYNNAVHYDYSTRTIAAGAATYLYPPPTP